MVFTFIFINGIIELVIKLVNILIYFGSFIVYMEKKKTLGQMIKEGRLAKKWTFDEFYWEYCHGNIPKRKVKGWEKDTYYPDLDEIYKIAALLNLNPNEMLEARDTKQKSTVREVNPSARRMGERIFKLTKPTIRFILNLIPIIAAIMLAVSYKLLDAGWNKKPELPKGMIEYYVGERDTDTTTNNTNVNTNISDSTENSNLTVNSEKDNENSDKNNDENINEINQ